MTTTSTETEIRCTTCAERTPGRRPTLLATVRATEVLEPVRLSKREAVRLGVPRSGLWWRRPAQDASGSYVLACRRCGTTTLYNT